MKVGAAATGLSSGMGVVKGRDAVPVATWWREGEVLCRARGRIMVGNTYKVP
jgi:hypothetical protein